MEWSHGKVMEKSLNFIPNFQYEPWEKVFSKMKTPRVLQEKDSGFRPKVCLRKDIQF